MLKATNLEAFYQECPWERPQTQEEIEKEKKDHEAWLKKEESKARRRRNYIPRGEGRAAKDIDWNKEDQMGSAATAGRKAGDRVNLQPFISGSKKKGELG